MFLTSVTAPSRETFEKSQGSFLLHKKRVGVFEEVEIQSFVGERIKVKAKVDTGAYRTSIDRKLARRLGLLNLENILYHGRYRSSMGKERRPIIELVFWLGEKKIKTEIYESQNP